MTDLEAQYFRRIQELEAELSTAQIEGYAELKAHARWKALAERTAAAVGECATELPPCEICRRALKEYDAVVKEVGS